MALLKLQAEPTKGKRAPNLSSFVVDGDQIVVTNRLGFDRRLALGDDGVAAIAVIHEDADSNYPGELVLMNSEGEVVVYSRLDNWNVATVQQYAKEHDLQFRSISSGDLESVPDKASGALPLDRMVRSRLILVFVAAFVAVALSPMFGVSGYAATVTCGVITLIGGFVLFRTL